MPSNNFEKEVGIQQKTFERGIIGNSSNPEARFIEDREKLLEKVDALRTLDLKIVLTSGTFDLLHVGHAKYLEVAKSFGDILIVGVDSDEKVRKRKGPDRPVVPEIERVNMLAHLRSVDIITLKQLNEPHWDLIKRIKPDTLVITEETYDKETIEELETICGQVICLEPQATTSTSAKVRRLEVGFKNKIEEPINKELEKYHANPELIQAIGRIIMGRKNE
jgi:cytidyltransferase-related domain